MVRLDPMSETDFAAWRTDHAREYAKDKVESGAWSVEDAPRLADEAYTQLLPQGLQTHDNFLYTAIDKWSGEKVGHIWFAKVTHGGQTFAFVYDVIIYEQLRRKGYGEQMMRAVEEKVREQGLDMVALHVFGHNRPAIALYEKIGYEVTDINMSKKIG